MPPANVSRVVLGEVVGGNTTTLLTSSSSPEHSIDQKNTEEEEGIETCLLNDLTSQTKNKHPSVYEEGFEMLTGALTIYTFADVRTMARQNELQNNTSLSDLEPPMTTDQVLAVIKDNKEALKKMDIDHDDTEKRLRTFEHLIRARREQQHKMEENAVTAASSDEQDEAKESNKLTSPVVAKLTRFVDTNSDKELVHGIVVNEARNRITVIFRGSVTQQDFIVDSRCGQKKVPNPVFKLGPEGSKLSETVNVHTGFYEYLTKKSETTNNETRLNSILSDVKVHLNEYPNCRLYVTGHSLGGALSTLFGFYAACDDEIITHGPVTIISFASPLVGNMDFRLSHQTLERMYRLRHLRVANKEDMVTLVPFVAPKLTALSPVLAAVMGGGNLYKHCGMRLQLRRIGAEREVTKKEGGEEVTKKKEGNDDKEEEGDDVKDVDVRKRFRITFAKDHGDDEAYAEEVRNAKEAGYHLLSSVGHLLKTNFGKITEFHSCDEYEARLLTCKDGLTTITLNDLYNDKSIVGEILNRDYQPKGSTLSAAKKAARFFMAK